MLKHFEMQSKASFSICAFILQLVFQFFRLAFPHSVPFLSPFYPTWAFAATTIPASVQCFYWNNHFPGGTTFAEWIWL